MAELGEIKVKVEFTEKIKEAIESFDKRLKRIEESLFGKEIDNSKEQLNLFKGND